MRKIQVQVRRELWIFVKRKKHAQRTWTALAQKIGDKDLMCVAENAGVCGFVLEMGSVIWLREVGKKYLILDALGNWKFWKRRRYNFEIRKEKKDRGKKKLEQSKLEKPRLRNKHQSRTNPNIRIQSGLTFLRTFPEQVHDQNGETRQNASCMPWGTRPRCLRRHPTSGGSAVIVISDWVCKHYERGGMIQHIPGVSAHRREI